MTDLAELQQVVGELHGQQWDGTPNLGRLIRIKILEESAELYGAMERENAKHEAHELGDLLFVLLAAARYLGHDAETCINMAIDRNRYKWGG